MLRSLRSKIVNPLRTAETSRSFVHGPRPWRKHAWLNRLPRPRPNEKLQHGTGDIKHPTGPMILGRGKEHDVAIDIDYMHVTPEDEKVGLVICGLHPKTRIKDLRNFLGRHTFVRHYWIHEEGTACVRFQDQQCKEMAQKIFEETIVYPFQIYNEDNRNWLGDAPSDTPPIRVFPLTAQYDQKERPPGSVLVMRSVIGLREATIALFRQYGTLKKPVRCVWTRFYAHDKWVWEYYLKFPTPEAATAAVIDLHQQKISIPYRHLSTVDKLLHPYGKTLHLWLQHTGLDHLPKAGTQDTMLKSVLYKSESVPLPNELEE